MQNCFFKTLFMELSYKLLRQLLLKQMRGQTETVAYGGKCQRKPRWYRPEWTASRPRCIWIGTWASPGQFLSSIPYGSACRRCHSSTPTTPGTVSGPSSNTTREQREKDKDTIQTRENWRWTLTQNPYLGDLLVILVKRSAILSVEEGGDAHNFFLLVDDGQRQDVLDDETRLIHCLFL